MKHIQIIFLGIAFWLSAAGVHAADPYLSALEAEADDTGSRNIEDTPPVSAASKGATLAGASADTIKTGLTIADFEKALKTSYSGSYFLYIRLGKPGRRAVFTQYREDNRIESIREEIVRQLSSG